MKRAYLVLSLKYRWSDPIEGETAADALAVWLATPDGGQLPDATLAFRLVKVESSGEIVELKRDRAGRYA